MPEDLFRYVALGDSSGVGVGSANDGGYPERLFQRLKREGVRAGILNLAQSGATSREVAQWQVQKAVSKQPSLVTLGVGTNDLWRMVPVGTFRMNLDLIANQLEAAGATVVVSNIIDLSLAPVAAMVEAFLRVPKQAFIKRVEEMNAVVNALGRRPRFTVVDLYGFSQRELAGHPEYFCQDGFHPSSVGYDRWADLMWPAVETVARAWSQRQDQQPGA
ncbi:MAG TPA: SGNH/GDSL hydrolase family protein [Myxococcaceae bacterium]|nr:SGNH/GDSL hydrolase family protein [Myxococcaceae bacterium]